jgi:hypothetical protein
MEVDQEKVRLEAEAEELAEAEMTPEVEARLVSWQADSSSRDSSSTAGCSSCRARLAGCWRLAAAAEAAYAAKCLTLQQQQQQQLLNVCA